MAKKIEIPSVLAFEKKLVPSDGHMYGTIWEERNNKKMPLQLKEKSVRGTISNRLKEKNNNKTKLDSNIKNPNLQTVDSCFLGANQDTLRLDFTLKVLSGVEKPSACDNPLFYNYYQKFCETYINKYGFEELANRYVINLANARFLWRNRVGAEKIEVNINILNEDVTFDATEVGIRDFKFSNNELNKIKKKVAEVLSGKNNFLFLDISTFVKLGRSQEVYPSEELILDKESNSKGSKSKILYHVKDQAAMHSQKIGNALRTIDTWYPEDDSSDDIGPIAIEPYGAVTNFGKAFRPPNKRVDFYSLFDKYVQEGNLNNEEHYHYIMAVLVRGGVFGKSKN